MRTIIHEKLTILSKASNMLEFATNWKNEGETRSQNLLDGTWGDLNGFLRSRCRQMVPRVTQASYCQLYKYRQLDNCRGYMLVQTVSYAWLEKNPFEYFLNILAASDVHLSNVWGMSVVIIVMMLINKISKAPAETSATMTIFPGASICCPIIIVSHL